MDATEGKLKTVEIRWIFWEQENGNFHLKICLHSEFNMVHDSIILIALGKWPIRICTFKSNNSNFGLIPLRILHIRYFISIALLLFLLFLRRQFLWFAVADISQFPIRFVDAVTVFFFSFKVFISFHFSVFFHLLLFSRVGSKQLLYHSLPISQRYIIVEYL